MSDLSPISAALTGPVNRVSQNGHASTLKEFIATPAADRPSDRVELSDRAKYLDRIRELPAVRRDVVERLRTQIDEGAYPSDEFLQQAVDRLLDELTT